MPIFNDEIIQKIFGKEDAENEEPTRLKEYFFRNKAYQNLTSNLAIRILVGHKGSGKSALLRVAHNEDNARQIVSLWLRPDDVRAVVPHVATGDLNARIESWKKALTLLIAREVATHYCDNAASLIEAEKTRGYVRDIITMAREWFSNEINQGLAKVHRPVIESFLKNNVIRIYLDDLDRGWEATKTDITNISALLNALRDICGHGNNLQFRLGLRSDVYYLVRTSDESTDKIEANLIFLNWINHDILIVAAKRIESFFGRTIDEGALVNARQPQVARYLEPVIEPRFQGAGKWENVPVHRVLLSMVRHRPRDLVKLLSGAARAAFQKDHEIITSGDLRETFESYSNERMQDLINEFRTEFPEIQKLLRGMKPSKRVMHTIEEFAFSNDRLVVKLKNLMSQARFLFTNGTPVNVHSLAQFLYKIDFLIARKRMPNGEIVRKFFDQNRYLNDQFVDFGFDWEIHPAYRWALQPADPLGILNVTELDSDDVDEIGKSITLQAPPANATPATSTNSNVRLIKRGSPKASG